MTNRYSDVSIRTTRFEAEQQAMDNYCKLVSTPEFFDSQHWKTELRFALSRLYRRVRVVRAMLGLKQQ